MLDRFGKRVFVGWAEHEIIWLKAAMTMTPRSTDDLRDIAEMTGRSLSAVRTKMAKLEAEGMERRTAEMLKQRSAVAGSCATSTPSVIPSGIRPLTRAQLMRGRA